MSRLLVNGRFLYARLISVRREEPTPLFPSLLIIGVPQQRSADNRKPCGPSGGPVCSLSVRAIDLAAPGAGDAILSLSNGQSYSTALVRSYSILLRRLGQLTRQMPTASYFSKQRIVNHSVMPPEPTIVVTKRIILCFASATGTVHRPGSDDASYVVALATTQQHKNIAMLLRVTHPYVPDDVLFIGTIGNADLHRLPEQEQALCFAVFSTTESFDPPLEAMIILSTPAVAAPCGARARFMPITISLANDWTAFTHCVTRVSAMPRRPLGARQQFAFREALLQPGRRNTHLIADRRSRQRYADIQPIERPPSGGDDTNLSSASCYYERADLASKNELIR